MHRTLLSSKIHRAVVTDANQHYIGSLTVDADLMDLAGTREFEQVHVVDVESGSRFVTYLIKGDPGSGVLCANGAAARLVQPGDHVIVLAYGLYDEAEAAAHDRVVVHVDEANRVLEPAGA
ncbi:MAG: aspartate 1-decarboxylase [Dehalococcoidia bacterium]